MNVKKQAKRYMRQILEYYAAVKLPLELDFAGMVGDLFIFQIDSEPGATEDKIRNYLEDVQQKLYFDLFQLHREGRELFFAVSEDNNFDNRVLGILTSPSYAEYVKEMKVPYPIGFNVMRRPVIVDLALYNNWLLGGAGFSGKTTGMQSWIVSVLWSRSPEHVNILIIDEPANMAQFSMLPHLSCPVIHNTDAGYKAIMKVYVEMKRRQKLRVENPAELKRLPILICFIDECVSFVVGVGKQKSRGLADFISLLLRLGRHVGIYLVLATQNSSLDEMKCDLNPVTSRIAFTCGKPTHSVTILGEGGAEKLSGKGELYFKSQNHSGLMYIKGANITSDEIEAVCNHIRTKYEDTEWDDRYKFTIDAASLQPDEEGIGDFTNIHSAAMMQKIDDKRFADIIMWSLEHETVSANAIKNAFASDKIGERKAKNFLEKLHSVGIVGEAKEKLGRKVLISCVEDLPDHVRCFLQRHNYRSETNVPQEPLNPEGEPNAEQTTVYTAEGQIHHQQNMSICDQSIE